MTEYMFDKIGKGYREPYKIESSSMAEFDHSMRMNYFVFFDKLHAMKSRH